MYIRQGMSYADFVSKACEQLDDDEDMHMMLSYDYALIYILKQTQRVEVEEGIVNVQNDYS